MFLIMRAGHSPESKKAFYKNAVDNLSSNPGIDPANAMISIGENSDIDWPFGEGVAQFVPCLLKPISYERGNIWRR